MSETENEGRPGRRRRTAIVGCGVGVAFLAAGGFLVTRDSGTDDGGGGAGDAAVASTTTTRPLSPDADRYELAYLSYDGEETTVFLTDGAGSETDVVARVQGRAEALVWSPDGSRLMLDGDASGSFDVSAIDVASGEVTALADGPANEGGASWSPDGSRIVFFSDREGGFAGYVAPAEGGEPTRVTAEGQDVSGLTWSPDGESIAYVVRGEGVDTAVWVVGADGSGARAMGDLPGAAMPRFSPDGAQLAVVAQPVDDASPDIHLLDVETGEATRLGGTEYTDLFPVWTADGAHVYFSAEAPNDDGSGAADDVYRIAIDGDGEPELVTQDPIGVEAEQSVTDDGELLVFSVRKLGDQEVFVANADGSGAITVSRSPRADSSPAWRPSP